jgi:hypothetical protein
MFNSKQTIILGDLNIDWFKSSPLKLKLDDFMALNGFSQLINNHTRVTNNSNTLIDLISSNSKIVKYGQVCHCDISDHFLIKCTVNSQIIKCKRGTITKRDFSRFDEINFFDHAKYANFFKVEEFKCPHQAALFLENLIVTLLNQHAPFKTTILRHNMLPWKTDYTLKLLKIRNKLYKKFKETGLNKNSSEWTEYKKARNNAVHAIRTAKAEAYKKLIENTELNLWTKIRIVKGTNRAHSTKIDFLNTDDQKLTSAHDICNSLNEYFSTIGLKLNQSLLTKNMHAGMKSNYINQPDGFSFAEVDSSVVAKTLTSLKNNKNGGLNQIPAFIYKILEPLILAPLTYIINLSITKCVFPDCWKEALVIPLFKGGDPSLHSNYRPVSLLPILSKVYEKILSNQIRTHLTDSSLLDSLASDKAVLLIN